MLTNQTILLSLHKLTNQTILLSVHKLTNQTTVISLSTLKVAELKPNALQTDFQILPYLVQSVRHMYSSMKGQIKENSTK